MRCVCIKILPLPNRSCLQTLVPVRTVSTIQHLLGSGNCDFEQHRRLQCAGAHHLKRNFLNAFTRLYIAVYTSDNSRVQSREQQIKHPWDFSSYSSRVSRSHITMYHAQTTLCIGFEMSVSRPALYQVAMLAAEMTGSVVGPSDLRRQSHLRLTTPYVAHQPRGFATYSLVE